MDLTACTSEGVANRVKLGSVGVIVPLGATEQHGPHLPLDVDSTIATAVANAVAERLGMAGHDCVVAPVLPFGDSAHHEAYAGSVSLRRDVVIEVLNDICESFLRAPFAWVALVTGHAGNCWAMRDIASRHAGGRVISVDDWPSMRTAIHNVARSQLGLAADYVGTHAGHFETSIMLHLRPDSVRMDRAEAGAIGDPSVLGARLRDEGMRNVSPNGVIGDPTSASADAGRLYLDSLVAYNETVILGRLAT